jgi:hypothetical protein
MDRILEYLSSFQCCLPPSVSSITFRRTTLCSSVIHLQYFQLSFDLVRLNSVAASLFIFSRYCSKFRCVLTIRSSHCSVKFHLSILQKCVSQLSVLPFIVWNVINSVPLSLLFFFFGFKQDAWDAQQLNLISLSSVWFSVTASIYFATREVVYSFPS